jgi:hypothetical protein
VSTPAHIEAHFLICYVTLVLLRLIQVDTGFRYSAAVIRDELRDLCCTHLDENWWLFDYRSLITDELCALAGIDFSQRIKSLAKIKEMLAITKRT